MKPLTIAVDVDETVADLLGPWLRRYNREYNDTLLPENIRGWGLKDQVKCGEKLYDLLDATLYDEVLPLPGARGGIYELAAAGHRILYVTSCTRGTADAKLAWLVRWGFLPAQQFQPSFIAASDKSLIRADVLFDDHIKNVEAFPGMAFLVDQPHNREESCRRPRVSGMACAVIALRQWARFSPYRDDA